MELVELMGWLSGKRENGEEKFKVRESRSLSPRPWPRRAFGFYGAGGRSRDRSGRDNGERITDEGKRLPVGRDKGKENFKVRES